MALTPSSARQSIICATASFTYADLATGVETPAVQVPQGAIVLGGFLVIDTAFNSGTSDTLTVGDATTADRYKAAINGQSAALTALIPTGLEYTVQDSVTVTNTIVGAAPTAGAGRLVLYYIVDGRAAFSQG